MHLQLGINGMAERLESGPDMTYLETQLAKQQARQLQFIREELIANVSDLIIDATQSDSSKRRPKEGPRGKPDRLFVFISELISQ